MTKTVREPIQVYLTHAERAQLDRAAREMGVSRSEALRRGIEAVTATSTRGVFQGLATAGYITPAAIPPGDAPPCAPVATLRKLLSELAHDRDRS